MTEATSGNAEEQQPPEHTLSGFLTSVAPYTVVRLTNAIKEFSTGSKFLVSPELLMHCGSDSCNGDRIFSVKDEFGQVLPYWSRGWVEYKCRNCASRAKLFALRVAQGNDGTVYAVKVGEWPAFGPPIPARVISLIGPDRELFIRGRRSEDQGLGIGAFGYYRRVVENQKNRLLDEIIRVARRTDAKRETIVALERARAETQFARAIDGVKDAIRESLRIRGQNPLTLLHSALSEGLHAQSDAECLELATAIRVVLTDLADNIGRTLRDEVELRDAVSRLMAKPKPPRDESSS